MSWDLDVEQLRQVCTRLLDQVETRFGRQIPIDDGPLALAEYWQVNLRDAYSLADSPGLEAAEFQSDLDEVIGVMTRPDAEVFLWHDMDHLAGVLRAFAYWDLPR